MASLGAVSITTIPKTWAGEDEFLDTVERFKAIRLLSLRNDPNCFGSTYSREVEYPDTRWQERLRSQDVFHIIASRPDGTEECTTQPSYPTGKWIGMIVPRRPGVQGEHYTITGMFVSPAARGTGIASRLLKHALEVIREDRKQRGGGQARVDLTVDTSNIAAVQLYQKCGFSIDYEARSPGLSGRPELSMNIILND